MVSQNKIHRVVLSKALLLGTSSVFINAHDKPNIVFILADDLGWSDVGYNGGQYYETPNIDKMATDGMIFTSCYTGGPNCAPTRACIISGTYTPRHKIYTPGGLSKGKTNYMKLKVPSRNASDESFNTLESSNDNLEPKWISVAELLSQAGYITTRLGKWHLGPDKQGFNSSSSNGSRGIDKKHYGDTIVAEKLTDAAIDFLEKNKENPFFLYLAHWDVHTPIRARKAVVQKYKKKFSEAGIKLNPTYAAMIEAVDKSVGKIRNKIIELELEDETLIIFTSDNGGVPSIADNSPLHGGKGSLFEGGIRVPACMTWPNVIKNGTICDVPITSVDFLPTFVELAGVDLPKSQPVDGVSIIPLIYGKNSIDRESIFWHYPLYLKGGKNAAVLPIYGTNKNYWRAVPSSAIRKGDWKLIYYYEDESVKLFNIKEDIGEQVDLSDEKVEITTQLSDELMKWVKSTNAPVPKIINDQFSVQ